MTLKEELEILRGEPIRVFDGDPMDIPCIETSDTEKLCKHPVVSVHMITYNHEPYIRQAIEGVMMQKTDFEFELVIGEDASQDKTREICFEYQKKYPDKIRVLWWHENVSGMGGNGRRVSARCRGEFLAYCEGDDYWVDPLKLQKQVDAMRRCSNVSICFGMMQSYEQKTGRVIVDEHLKSKWPNGMIDGREFAVSDYVIPTPTVLLRRSVFDRACEKYEALSWGMKMGDFQLWKAMALEGAVYCLHDLLSTYRIHGTSAMHLNTSRIMRDSGIMMLYFSKVTSYFPAETIASALRRLSENRCRIIASTHDKETRKEQYNRFVMLGESYATLLISVGPIGLCLTKCGYSKLLSMYLRLRRGILNRFYKYFLMLKLDGTVHIKPISLRG